MVGSFVADVSMVMVGARGLEGPPFASPVAILVAWWPRGLKGKKAEVGCAGRQTGRQAMSA